MDMKRSARFGMSFLAVLLLSATAGHAEMNLDLRLKLGGVPGVDTVEFSNTMTGNATDNGGGNFQIELMLSDKQEYGPYFVGGVGIFGRSHEGNVPDPVLPTDVQYDAGGVSGTAGIGFKADQNLHFEGRVELDLGSGKPTLTTPGFAWNSVKDGGYSAFSLIFGGYYTFSKPGLQLGFELGAQSFVGEFQIWNNAGFWEDSKVKGSGGLANLVIGFRF